VIPSSRGTAIAAQLRAAAFAALTVVAACDGDGAGSTPVPAGIRFLAQPVGVVAGVPFAVTVELLDGASARAVAAGAIVQLELDAGATLSGATAIAAVRGLAAFDDLVITQAAPSLRLDAAAAGRAATSQQFAVSPGAPSLLRSAFAPTEFVWTQGTPVPMSFTFVDSYGNPLAGLPVALASSLPGSSFVPNSGTTTAAGTFVSAFNTTSGGSATITATVDGHALVFDTPFVVSEFCRPGALAIPGTVTGTLPSGLCDANGRPAAVYSFTLGADGAVAFTTTAAFAPRVEVKTRLTETNPEFLPTSAFPTVEWLLPAGAYLFRVSAQSGTGAYTVRGDPVAGTSGVVARAIVAGGTYAGQSLQINDREFGDGTVYDYFLMFSLRSCTITMRSTAFDALLWVDDAIQLQFIAIDDNGAGGTDARVRLDQCHSQGRPIGVLANSNPTPQLGPGLGAYTLTIEYGNLPAAALPDGAAIGGDVLRPRPTGAPALRMGARRR